MSSSELKRGRASRSPSPKSGRQENKRLRVDDEDIDNVLGGIGEEENELLVGLESNDNDKVKVEASPALPTPKGKENAGNLSSVPAASIGEAAEVRKSLPVEGEEPLLARPATPVPVVVAGEPLLLGQGPAQTPQTSPDSSPEVLIILGGIIDLTGDTDDEEERAPPPRAPTIIDLTGDADDEEERPQRSHIPPNPNEPRARSPRSPTPFNDERIALWKQETRHFPGTMTMDIPDEAKIRAERACTSPLWVNGVPKIIICCDGSRKSVRNRESEASSGGYGLVLRNPWANNINNVDNQQRAAAGSAAAPIPFGFTSQSGFGVRSWSYRKVYSPAHAESGALAQSLSVALQLVEQNRPESVIIELFTGMESMESVVFWLVVERGVGMFQNIASVLGGMVRNILSALGCWFEGEICPDNVVTMICLISSAERNNMFDCPKRTSDEAVAGRSTL